MSPFNPDPAPVQDRFLDTSRSIEQPRPNSAAGDLLKGFGNAFDEGVTSADKIVKEVIGNQESAKVNPVQDEYLSSVATAADAEKSAASQGGKLTTDNLLASAPKVPDSVDNAINAAQVLQSARSNGKISETAYLGKLYTVLKDTRSAWPAYRDYVDKKMSEITGKDVANSYLTSLIGDINASQTNAKAEKEKTLTQAWDLWQKTGDPKGVQMVSSGQWGASELAQHGSPLLAAKYMYDIKKQNYDSREMDDKEAKAAASDLVDTLGEKSTATQFSSISATDQIYKQYSEIIKSGQTPNPDAARAALAQVAQAKVQAGLQYDKDMNDPANGIKGKPLRQFQTTEQYEAGKKAKLAKFDDVMSLLSSEQFGALHGVTNAYKDIADKDKLNIVNDVTMGGTVRLGNAMKDMSPEFLKQYATQVQDLNIGTAGAKTWLYNKGMEFNTGQTDSGKGVPVLKDAIIKLNNEPKLTPEVKAQTGNQLIGFVEKIADPNTPDKAKINLVKAAYSPANGELLQNFKGPGPGGDSQMNIFSRMTSADIVKEVFRLSKTPDGAGIWPMYKSWAQQTFGQELFASDLKSLAALQTVPGRVGWDNEHHQFTPPPVPTGFVSSSQRQARNYVTNVIARINDGLYQLKPIADAEGSDMNRYILQTLQNFRAVNPDTMKGLPQDMYDAVANQKKNEEKYKKDITDRYTPRKPE